ncbi:unnamed protein product [Protopolystoma xenopodis]|uniref:Uncharacterized protein n=1 Tax=Protopolystoma xenopodis TaxID=117903 RepID=A0A3S5BSQ5_9PLAT|nr:unnamed protein product [Protopolystoma xenopodis]
MPRVCASSPAQPTEWTLSSSGSGSGAESREPRALIGRDGVPDACLNFESRHSTSRRCLLRPPFDSGQTQRRGGHHRLYILTCVFFIRPDRPASRWRQRPNWARREDRARGGDESFESGQPRGRRVKWYALHTHTRAICSPTGGPRFRPRL